MSETDTIGVGILGFGFMGRVHAEAYDELRRQGTNLRIAALCDANIEAVMESQARGNLDSGAQAELELSGARQLARTEELFADPAVDLVSICTHTDTHVDLAIAALEANKHVLVEKPISLSSSEVERLAAAARESDRVCMPAMCIRFWPGWSWLREHVHAGTFGAVRSAAFRRFGPHPGWSPFYADSEKNGGALFDLHVHDADFLRWCFGEPTSVVSTGDLDHLTTGYRFADGPRHVTAEGGWDLTPGYPFQMGYTVVFEEATAEFVLGREPLLTLARKGEVEPVEIADSTGYLEEIRHVLAVIGEGAPQLATIEEAVGLTRMLEAERESLKTGAPVALQARS